MDLREIQELIDTIPEKLIEDNLTKMSATEPAPDDEESDIEETMPENKLALDHLAEVSNYSRLLLALMICTLP